MVLNWGEYGAKNNKYTKRNSIKDINILCKWIIILELILPQYNIHFRVDLKWSSEDKMNSILICNLCCYALFFAIAVFETNSIKDRRLCT